MTSNEPISGEINLVFDALKRPGLYGVERVEDLKLLMIGYQLGVAASGPPFCGLAGELTTFVHEETARKHRTADFAHVIRYETGSNSGSLRVFRHYLIKYLEQHARLEQAEVDSLLEAGLITLEEHQSIKSHVPHKTSDGS